MQALALMLQMATTLLDGLGLMGAFQSFAVFSVLLIAVRIAIQRFSSKK